MFARLAVFRGGRSLEAIEEVCDPAGEIGVEILEGLQSLLDKSLLRRETDPSGESRFVMLETIHEYAWERLRESPDAEELRRRHCEHFVALAERSEPRFDDEHQATALRQFDVELDNVRAAHEWALEAGEPALALRLASALSHYWDYTGKGLEALRLLSAALAQREPIGNELRARALLASGIAAQQLSDCEAADGYLMESLTLFRRLELLSGQAESLLWLAASALLQGDLVRAESLAEEGIALARSAGDKHLLGRALNTLGTIALERGNYKDARTSFQGERPRGSERVTRAV